MNGNIPRNSILNKLNIDYSYRFNDQNYKLKEGKRDKLAELREQFEADKKKVEKLKQTKKFKGL